MKREIREEIQKTQEHQQERRDRNKQIQNIALATSLAAAGGFGIYLLASQLKNRTPESINMAPEKQRKAATWIKNKFNDIKQDKARVIKIQ